MKKSFVLYTDYIKQISLLNMEQRGTLFTAILQDQGGEEVPEMDSTVEMAFAFIKADIDRNREKYEAI